MLHTSITGPKYYQSSFLSVPHGMFCRHGGMSPAPFNSLNFSYHAGDKRANIEANRKLAQKLLNLSFLRSAHQIHSDKVAVITDNNDTNEISDHDALVSNLPGTGLLIQQADCQAILLHDPVTQSIGAAHNGWKGSVANIIKQTIRSMQENFGTDPQNLRAVISPSLGPCCAEFIHYRDELPKWMHPFQVRKNHFDFWAISRIQLIEAGVRPSLIETAGLCTRCRGEFFSYRRSRAQGKTTTGRNGSIIGLPDNS